MKRQFPYDMIEIVASALCCPQGCECDDRPCLRDTHRTQAWDVLDALDKQYLLMPSPLHVAITADELRHLRFAIGTVESRVRDVVDALEAQQKWITRIVRDEPVKTEGSI